jgi:signal transduction histidine kinase
MGWLLNRLRSNLRLRLLAGHMIVVVVGVVTLFLAAGLVGPLLFEQLMDQVTGPRLRALGHEMTPQAAAAMETLTAQAFVQAMAVSLAVAASAATIVAVAASLFISERIARPALRMASAARRIAAGHYAERVPAGEVDELGQLADSFNEMATALEAVERRRLELVGTVAHELRTPIANIQGYLEGMLDGVVEPSGEVLAFLHDEAGRLRRLVEDLQELSRAEARQLSFSFRPVAPSRVVDAAVARLAPQFAEKGLSLTTEVSAHLPNILADEDRAVQVLTNLLSNALRYTGPGGSVEVSAHRDGDAVLFRVRDTGIGIEVEHLPHLFERFYRVDKARTRAAGGSGIGLTIARSLVETMGGRIWAESPGPGRGTVFTFTLPTAE